MSTEQLKAFAEIYLTMARVYDLTASYAQQAPPHPILSEILETYDRALDQLSTVLRRAGSDRPLDEWPEIIADDE